MAVDPVFFATPSEFRAWLERHHETESELLVGFYRTKTGRPGIRWAQSVDEALCFGWIDGVRRGYDTDSYTIRFTPRTATSTWSTVNVRRIGELTEQGLVAPAGLAAFARRTDTRTSVYAHEQGPAELDSAEEAEFRANAPAWEFFAAQAPSYRKVALHWVVRAKRPETRRRRLDALIAGSAIGERTGPGAWRPSAKTPGTPAAEDAQ
jgi:uncharacterized protein YdeI (YjbR/CyaY-like superfamily)